MDFKHLHFQSAGFINEHISFICSNPHYFEYPMPEPPKVSSTIIYDWSDTDDIVKILFPGFNNEQVSAKCKEVVMAKIEDYTNDTNGCMVCNFDMDNIEDTHLFRVTIWTNGNQEERESIIDDYIHILAAQAVQNLENASGDDSYYDYAPAFYDVFRQVCQLFGGKYQKLYNDTTADIMENDNDLELYGPETII